MMSLYNILKLFSLESLDMCILELKIDNIKKENNLNEKIVTKYSRKEKNLLLFYKNYNILETIGSVFEVSM